MAFIKSKLRRFEGDDEKIKKDTEEVGKSDVKQSGAGKGADGAQSAGAARAGPGSSGADPANARAAPSYRSQIDYLFLIWKALDFEQLFDAVNAEEPDQILGIFSFMNDSQNRAEAEDGGPDKQPGHDLGAKSGGGIGEAGPDGVEAEATRAAEEQQRKRAAEIADSATIRYHHLISSKLYKDKQLNQVTDLQHELWTTVLDHYERHCLWFNIFNTLDRVRLWNRLVFSEGYFRLLANPARRGRSDLREYLRENLDAKARDELLRNWDKYFGGEKQGGADRKKAGMSNGSKEQKE